MDTSIVAENTSKVNQPGNINPIIRVGISRAFHNKENLTGNKSAFGNSFIPTELTLPDFIQHVLSGGAFTPGYFKGRSRNKKTFISSQLLGLDFDQGISVADCAAHPFIKQYAFLIYPTPSSTPELPKTRVLFLLSEPVYEVARWEAMQRGMIQHFADWKPDPACKDAARLFYGSDKSGAIEVHHA